MGIKQAHRLFHTTTSKTNTQNSETHRVNSVYNSLIITILNSTQILLPWLLLNLLFTIDDHNNIKKVDKITHINKLPTRLKKILR